MAREAPYRQIAAHYRALITRGALLPGAHLPTVRAMAGEWGVNRVTASKAVLLLRDEGYVITAGRNGTIVADHSTVHRAAPDDFVDEMVRATQVVSLVVPEGKALLVRLVDDPD